ncbi:hypothetical protein [Endozoicomonas sp. Mp262]|uniref:hypothetical protein n=1 Tax=Endozoicomonas sp. Mp262 TaxID=2919499 RepID=UPI0021D8E268
MDWRDQVIADVGRGMGVEGLEFTGSGVIQLEFERRGQLFIEAREKGVLFYLTRGLPQYDCVDMLVRALQAAHYSSSMRYPLQAGLKGDRELFLCIFLGNEEFDRPNIEGVMQILADQFDRIVE